MPRPRRENHILPRLGDRELTELTSKTVGRFLADCQAGGNHRRDKPLSQETMRHILSLLTKVLAQAVADGVMTENSAKAYSIKNTKQVKATALSPWEVECGELVEYDTQMRTLHLSEYAVEPLIRNWKTKRASWRIGWPGIALMPKWKS